MEAVSVANGFLFDVAGDSFSQVDASLVGYCRHYPQKVGQFVSQIRFFAWLEGLVAIYSSHLPRHFASFFSEDSHIGQWGEIFHPDSFNPFVDQRLQLADCQIFACLIHSGIILGDSYSLRRESMMIVTGPSLAISTNMSAPKMPFFTSMPVSCCRREQYKS